MSDRDAWCTPSWLTAMLPPVDLDPCSNGRSTVRASRTYAIERGEDGLSRLFSRWAGRVWINPPYSDVMPWADRLVLEVSTGRVNSAGVLVNVDPSTAWWRRLCEVCTDVFLFGKRLAFDPPPGVEPSANDRAQALLCVGDFRSLCSPELAKHGAWWMQQRKEAA